MADVEKFRELGIIECPNCKLSSLSWNMTCARCDADLMPDKNYPNDDAERHKQINAA